MVPSQDRADPKQSGKDYPFRVRVRRSLARRFPGLRIAYNWTWARIRHLGHAVVSRTRRFFTTFLWLGSLIAQLARLRRQRGLVVGVDVASLWEPLTGVGWYLYLLLRELADTENLTLRLFPPTIVASDDLSEPVVSLPVGRAIQLVRLEVPPDRVIFAGATIRSLRRIEPLLRALVGSSVVFAPNFYPPRSFALSRAPLVATVHDLGSVQVPWTLSDDTLGALTERLERTLAQATRLITVSETVRSELVQQGYPHPERIAAIHHGPGLLVGVEEGEVPESVPERFALHVGTLEPRKNIETLIEAWRIVWQSVDEAPPLVLGGRYGWKSDEIRSAVDRGVDRGQVLHLGYVSDRQLAALYRRACLVVLPSLYEGFGLPAVEAQFSGTPLICSDIPVLREVAAEGALFAPPGEADLIAQAVCRVLTDPSLRDSLIRRGHEAVSRLSWKRAAEQTLAVWRLAAREAGHEPSEGLQQ